MVRSRLFSIAAVTTAAITLSGCLATPIGPAGTYNTAPGYQQPLNTNQTLPPGNYYGRAEVVNVQVHQGSGGAQGAGALIGGLAGGAVGNQIARKSHGDRRAAATVSGAAVGALIGHYIQQNYAGNYAGQPVYRVTVRANNGSLYTFDYSQNPNVHIGEQVQIQNGQLYRLQY